MDVENFQNSDNKQLWGLLWVFFYFLNIANLQTISNITLKVQNSRRYKTFLHYRCSLLITMIIHVKPDPFRNTCLTKATTCSSFTM